MATLREWLEAAGFDWSTGRVIVQFVGDKSCADYTKSDRSEEVGRDHQILDAEFDCADCPMFIAEDGGWIYFPGVYDSSSWLVRISKNLSYYLNPENPTPVVGGG